MLKFSGTVFAGCGNGVPLSGLPLFPPGQPVPNSATAAKRPINPTFLFIAFSLYSFGEPLPALVGYELITLHRQRRDPVRRDEVVEEAVMVDVDRNLLRLRVTVSVHVLVPVE